MLVVFTLEIWVWGCPGGGGDEDPRLRAQISALGRWLFCTDFEKSHLGTVMAAAVVAKDYTTLTFWQQGVLAVKANPG